METLFNNLFRKSGTPFALYLYRRIVRPELQKQNLDQSVVSTIATDFITFGTSTSPEGLALQQVVMDQVHIGAPTLVVADVTAFMKKLGEEILVDYPVPPVTP